MSRASTVTASGSVTPTTKKRGETHLHAGHGRRAIARKELADHLYSIRFVVLLAISVIVSVVIVFSNTEDFRSIAENTVGVPGLFLRLFTVDLGPLPFTLVSFMGFIGPLLGIFFGFDSVIGERSQGTLPRLLSQPVYRDEVITGKFMAGVTVIGVMLTLLTASVTALGIWRLGFTPTAADTFRLLIWLFITIGYVGLWLALATLISVTVKRAATSALISFGIWMVIILFGAFIFQAVGNIFGGDDPNSALETEQLVSQISPYTLYTDASSALLDPTTRTTGLVTLEQVDRAILSELTPIQGVLIVGPQILALLVMTAVAFGIAFWVFIRQDIRA